MNALFDNKDYRNLAANLSKDFIESSSRGIDTIKKLDNQILSLIYQRSCVISTVNSDSVKFNTFKTYVMEDFNEVKDQWSKNGFNSSIVKQTVANIRSLFFDDNDPKFQALSCNDIDCNDSCGSNIGFIFADDNGHAFKISFLISQYKRSDVTDRELFDGLIYFTTFDENGEMAGVCKSLDFNEIKNSISSWVNSGYSTRFHHVTLADIPFSEQIAELFRPIRRYQDDYY